MNSPHSPQHQGRYPQESSDQEILERTGEQNSKALAVLGGTTERNHMIKVALAFQDEIDEEIRNRKEEEKTILRERQNKTIKYAVVARSQNMEKILAFFETEKSDLSFLDDADVVHFLSFAVTIYLSNRKTHRKEVPKDVFLRKMYDIMKGEYEKRGMTSPIPNLPQKIETKATKQKAMVTGHALSASR